MMIGDSNGSQSNFFSVSLRLEGDWEEELAGAAVAFVCGCAAYVI